MSPDNFNKCVKNGGRVRRRTLKGGRYINICFLNGKSYAGETHEMKGPQESKAKSGWSANL